MAGRDILILPSTRYLFNIDVGHGVHLYRQVAVGRRGRRARQDRPDPAHQKALLHPHPWVAAEAAAISQAGNASLVTLFRSPSFEAPECLQTIGNTKPKEVLNVIITWYQWHTYFYKYWCNGCKN